MCCASQREHSHTLQGWCLPEDKELKCIWLPPWRKASQLLREGRTVLEQTHEMLPEGHCAEKPKMPRGQGNEGTGHGLKPAKKTSHSWSFRKGVPTDIVFIIFILDPRMKSSCHKPHAPKKTTGQARQRKDSRLGSKEGEAGAAEGIRLAT